MVLAELPVQSSSSAINVLSSYILFGTLGPQQGYFLRITFEKKSVTSVFGPEYNVGEPKWKMEVNLF